MNDWKWIVPGHSPEADAALSREAGIGMLAARILRARGVTSAGEAELFLHPERTPLTDPLGMPGMAAAAERLRRAAERREQVGVIGDYDADGVTATYIVSDYLRRKDVPCLTHIPDRATEGYGASVMAVEQFAREGVSLIVTVDTGITAFDAAVRAAELGVDLVITDHHACKERLPDALAVVDPWREDCPEVYRPLAGVGVAFKLICAAEGGSQEELLARYADVCALGTVADVMKLRGENRRIVAEGLQKLSRDPNPGLQALLRASGDSGDRVDTQTVSFRLAPRINAAGRMTRADVALGLLSAVGGEAEEVAEELCRQNVRRQEVEQKIRAEAEAILTKRGFSPAKDGAIFLKDETWNTGVLGIVCARLAEQYGCPAVLATRDGDLLKASARSVRGFHLYHALEALSEYLVQFGGHELAAGLTVEPDKADAFGAALGKFALEHRDPEGTRVRCADAEATARELTETEVRGLEALAPFGEGNPEPVFYLRGLHLDGVTALKDGRHTRLHLSDGKTKLTCIAFGRSPESLPAAAGDRVEILTTVGINTFRGNSSVNLYLQDIRPDDETFRAAARAVRGEMLTPEERKALLPTREECARVWRTLAARKGSVRPTEFPAEGAAPALSPGKVYLILHVFLQAGIAREEGGEILALGSPPRSDLEATALMRALRGE